MSLNDHVYLAHMIGSFISGGTASLVAKNKIKNTIPLLRIKSSNMDRFWYIRFLNDCLHISALIRPNLVVFRLAGLSLMAV